MAVWARPHHLAKERSARASWPIGEEERAVIEGKREIKKRLEMCED